MLRVRNLLRQGARKRIQRRKLIGVKISRQRHSRRRTTLVVVDRETQLKRIAGGQIRRDLKARHAQSAGLSIKRTLKINVRRDVTRARLQHKLKSIRAHALKIDRKPAALRLTETVQLALNMRPQLICNILRGEARLNTEVRVEHLHVIHEDVHAQISALIEIGQLRLRRDRNPRLGDLLCDAALIDRNFRAH